MNTTWIIIIILIGAIFVYARFKKTKLLSNFPFTEGETSVFEEKPSYLAHKQYSLVGAKTNHNYHILMRPLIKITNKKRIIFAQIYKEDAIVYGVFSMDNLTETELAAWKDKGYAFAMLPTGSVTATTGGKKAQYEITFTAAMQGNIAAITRDAEFIMQVYTNDIDSYEKALGITIPVS